MRCIFGLELLHGMYPDPVTSGIDWVNVVKVDIKLPLNNYIIISGLVWIMVYIQIDNYLPIK